MAKLDNPAGRLHDLLTDFVQQARGANGSILTTWQGVFDAASTTETLLRIAETAGLLPSIERVLQRIGDRDQLTLFYGAVDDLLVSVVQPRADIHSTAARSMLPPDYAVAALGGVSAFLSIVASEGPVPDAGTRDGVRAQVQELIDGIATDPDLPEEVKRLALDHAYRLAQALDHFRIGGPGAVRAATEQLLGAVAMAPDRVRRHGVWQRVLTTFSIAWQVFSKGQDVHQALEGWVGVIGQLPPGGS